MAEAMGQGWHGLSAERHMRSVVQPPLRIMCSPSRQQKQTICDAKPLQCPQPFCNEWISCAGELHQPRVRALPHSFYTALVSRFATHLQENYTNYDKGVLAEILEPIMGKGLIPAGTSGAMLPPARCGRRRGWGWESALARAGGCGCHPSE